MHLNSPNPLRELAMNAYQHVLLNATVLAVATTLAPPSAFMSHAPLPKQEAKASKQTVLQISS